MTEVVKVTELEFNVKVQEAINKVVVATPGPQGPSGKGILNGNGAPAANLGIEGDFYYDKATTRFYGPKLSLETWDGSASFLLNKEYFLVYSWELAQVTGPASPVIQNYTVTNSGSSAYAINGESNPTLTLVRGQTYFFTVNAPGHPFWIKTTSTTGTGNQYNTGVNNNGDDVGEITFTVNSGAPSTLYYICQFHSSMAGTINIVDPPATTDSPYSLEINHNLGFYPNVTVKTSAGDILETGIDYNSINKLTLTMAQPFSGTAYLS